MKLMSSNKGGGKGHRAQDPKKRDFVDVLYDFIPGIPVNGDVDSKTGRK